MKIAVLLPDIERWSSFHGGACARVVEETIAQPSFSEMEVMVFCPSCHTKYAYSSPQFEPRFMSFWLFLNRFFRKISPSLDGWMWILPQYLKLKKYDLIHIHNRPHYGLILRKLGYKGVIINHLQNDFNKSSTTFAKTVVDSCEMVISCSQNISDRFFEKYPQGKHKAAVLNNGANPDKFAYGPLEGRKKQLIFMGRNDPIKGIDLLLDAYERLLIKHPDLKLVMTGSAKFGDRHDLTDFERKIHDRIKEINQNGGHIQHEGYVEYERLPVLLRESLIFCLPSVVHDAFPLVILDAMFTGTPIVSTKMGGIPEAVGKWGALAEPNVDSLYQELDALLQDQQRLSAYNIHSHQRALEHYSWSTIAEKQYNIYKSFEKN